MGMEMEMEMGMEIGMGMEMEMEMEVGMAGKYTPFTGVQKKGLRTFCRWENGMSTVSIKAVADCIDCSLFNLIGMEPIPMLTWDQWVP